MFLLEGVSKVVEAIDGLSVWKMNASKTSSELASVGLLDSVHQSHTNAGGSLESSELIHVDEVVFQCDSILDTMLQTRIPLLASRLRTFSTGNALPEGPIVHIPRSSIYPLGVNNKSGPLFRDVSWTVQPDEAWAVLSTSSSGAKTSLLQALTGHLRISPPPPPPYDLFPFLKGRDAHKHVSLVSFAHRPQNAGGAFYDFTARYGAVREEDKRTLRETFFPETAKPLHDLAIPNMYTHPDDIARLHSDHAEDQSRRGLFEELTVKLDLKQFLDLPLIALSNGQTRKARIVKALLEQPELIILDEPLSEC